jgi:hypothetical protein
METMKWADCARFGSALVRAPGYRPLMKPQALWVVYTQEGHYVVTLSGIRVSSEERLAKLSPCVLLESELQVWAMATRMHGADGNTAPG